MRIVGIIPARMASTRFPGKPLADIMGRPMIHHVYFRSGLCTKLDELYIATCDREIRDYCEDNGIKVVMTKDTHERASDRAAEAISKIDRRTGKRTDIVVMIQGDEPLVLPEMIDRSLRPILRDKSIDIVNLMAPIGSKKEQKDPNLVKVVVDRDDFALYFSREPIPSWKKGAKDVPMYKQVPIIPFTRDFLTKFNRLSATPLEVIESVDMLRVMEHGYKVKMVPVSYGTQSVDTLEDLEKVRKMMKKDKLFRKRYE